MEKRITKLYYSISEVAGMFGVSNSLLRFWESEFDLLKPKKNKKGDRKYTEKDIHHVRMIYHLVKEKGYTLEGAKRELKEKRAHLSQKFEYIEKLKELKNFLGHLGQELSPSSDQ